MVPIDTILLEECLIVKIDILSGVTDLDADMFNYLSQRKIN